jgi:Enhancer of polycomb-like
MAGLIIPTPEVSDVKDDGFYDKNYPADYKMPRQMIHVQRKNSFYRKRSMFNIQIILALSLEQDIPDYDMDSADEMWFDAQTSKPDMSSFKFEQMMDRLEKITVCSLDDAKALVRRNEVNQDVFDYWVNKRLKTVCTQNNYQQNNAFFNNLLMIFRNIHSYWQLKQKIGEILRLTILILHLEEEQKKCKQGKIERTMKLHMKRCLN